MCRRSAAKVIRYRIVVRYMPLHWDTVRSASDLLSDTHNLSLTRAYILV
jgi:hypothetical protein